MLTLLRPAALSLALCPVASAAEPTVVLEEEQSLGAAGHVDSLRALSVTDDGVWAVLVEVRPASGDSFHVVVSDPAAAGVPEIMAQPGDPLPGFPGATVSSVWDAYPSPEGRFAYRLGVEGSTVDWGLFVGSELVLWDRAVSTSPDLPAGTVYGGWPSTRRFARFGFAGVARLVGPEFDHTANLAVLRTSLDAQGQRVDELLVHEGQQPPGAVDVVRRVESRPHAWDVNASGQVLYQTEEGTFGTGDVSALWLDDQRLIQTGAPSPTDPSEVLHALFGRDVGLNDHGSFVANVGVKLPGERYPRSALLRDLDEVLLEEGDVLPRIAPGGVEGIAQFSLGYANNGTWAAVVDDAYGEALVVNGRVVTRTGDALSNGLELDRFLNDPAMSPDGEWWVQKVRVPKASPVFPNSRDVVVVWNLSEFLEPRPPQPAIAGHVTQWTVEHAVPGHEVAILVGRRGDGGAVVPCGGQDVDLDLQGAMFEVGRAVADAHGTVAVSGSVPAWLGGRRVSLQAVDLTRCVVSETVDTTL